MGPSSSIMCKYQENLMTNWLVSGER